MSNVILGVLIICLCGLFFCLGYMVTHTVIEDRIKGRFWNRYKEEESLGTRLSKMDDRITNCGSNLCRIEAQVNGIWNEIWDLQKKKKE